MDPNKARKILEKQYKKQNEYNKENYYRVSVLFPKDVKERIAATGQSANSFIKAATLQALEEYEAAAAPASADQEQETNISTAAYMVPPETKEEQPETAAPLASDVARLRAIAEQAKRNNQELRNEEN